MFKQIITTVFALVMSAFTFSQVGIDTETPQATLDVVGKPTDNSVLDGIIAPRLEGAQLRAKTYTSAQTGALVYVTVADTAPAGQTIDVTAEGYYYFNGVKWIIAGAGDLVNIYNSDGALTDERILDINGKELNFKGSKRNTYWDSDGRIHQESTDPSSDAVMGFHGGNNSNLYIQQWNNSNAAVTATGNSTKLLLATHYTTDPAPITFNTSPGGNTTGVERMIITGEGNVGVNTDSPTEKLDVDGITRLRILPLNGAVNAHHTIGGNDTSATQDQTFTATRTIVADANGVLGYVTGLPAASQNIYNTNGTLTSNRVLSTSDKSLEFNVNSLQRTFWNPTSGSLNQMGLTTSPTKHASMVFTAADNNGNAVTSTMSFQIYPEQPGQIIASRDATGLSLSTNQTTVSAPIAFHTSSGGGALATQKMTITGIGNVGINTNTPTAKFHVVKSAADITPAIIEGCNVYADNAAATEASVPVGGLYRKSDGTLMVRF